MPTNVVMPQMGESIAEGTIVRWIKQLGDRVDRDEPLFEISTDKVDAEIPSPCGGVLAQITVKEGETVPVESVVAVIAEDGDAPTVVAAADPDTGTYEAPAATTPAVMPEESVGSASLEPGSVEARRRLKSSPLVRRIAGDHGVDLALVAGSGIGGRVTKRDILAHLESGETITAAAPMARPAPEPAPVQAFQPGERVEVVPMSVMRRKIAEHMIASRRTSAHVHSVFEVDFSRVAKIREAKKAEYERAGVKLTYLAFIAKAAIDALRAVPVVNAAIDGENIVYKKDINLGIAVALDWGLIVPVIKNADEKNILGLSRAVADLAERARAKKLKAEEVQGGTFTITNPGMFGNLFGLPIINQPQVAILGVGIIEKRPMVVDDAIAIRPMAYLALGFDHRLVDGAVADRFMSLVKQQLENFDPAAV